MKILPGPTIKVADNEGFPKVEGLPWRPNGGIARSPERVIRLPASLHAQESHTALEAKRRGDAPTSPLRSTGLAKQAPVTASYVTRRSTLCLPLCPTIWDIGVIGTGRSLSVLRAIRCVSFPTKNVRRRTCPSHPANHKTR